MRVEGLRVHEPLKEVLEAPDECALAGSLLVGLHAAADLPSSGDGAPPRRPPSLLVCVSNCFRALSMCSAAKDPEAVETIWKGYLECLLEGVQTWKQIRDPNSRSVLGIARAAVHDVAVAATGVTKRALGCESCVNREAMEAEFARRRECNEELRANAVSVARQQVMALGLETLSDPEAFLRFLQHDPIKAFEAAPAAVQAFMEAEAAQRVLLFAKLMGLVAMAGSLLRGEAKVQAAFDAPLPLKEDISIADFAQHDFEADEDVDGSAAISACDGEASARRAVCLLQAQRLRLARTRLLVAGGAPDVGKTTLLREIFGFKHFVAGLSRTGQTEQITFALHPDGDERHRPVYAVDTPGFGDGERIHRNDMVRLLLGAGGWIPGGVTLLWVVKAGRHVRQEADDILRQMAADPRVSTLVVVTHVDNFFEERYREVGPQWRDGILQGVPHKDPRWKSERRKLMEELRSEVEEGVEGVVGRRLSSAPAPQGAGGTTSRELAFACLGGWMAATEENEEDEFAQSPPWPWARQELTEFFGILGRQELRTWFDTKLGI